MTYSLTTKINNIKFEFNEYGNMITKEYKNKGELYTTMCLKFFNENFYKGISKRLFQEIPGINSLDYLNKGTLMVERVNHLFKWEEIVEPLFNFIYLENPDVEIENSDSSQEHLTIYGYFDIIGITEYDRDLITKYETPCQKIINRDNLQYKKSKEGWRMYPRKVFDEVTTQILTEADLTTSL